MKIRRVYEQLLKQEKRTVLRLKCLSGATAFIVFSVFLMMFLGLDVVRKIAKGFSFEKGVCVVQESSFNGSNVSCACGMHTCCSKYPCLRVLVKMAAKSTEDVGTSQPALLHNTIYDLGSECTYGPPCQPNYSDNFASVLKYKNSKEQRENPESFQCYFNPNDPTEVILDKSAHETLAFHAMFWPCSAFITGLCILLKTYYMRKAHKKQDVVRPQDIELEETLHTSNNNICNYHLVKSYRQ